MRSISILTLFVAWLIAANSLIFAQPANLSFDHYTVAHGLSAPVTRIVQDKYGFLWLGTTDGLNRFDGNSFIVHRNIPGDTNSIPSNIINALHVDDDGKVWTATNRGLCYYDFTDDRFHRIVFNDTLESIDRHRVHAVTAGDNRSIWFATRSHLHQWRDGLYRRSVRVPASENYLIKFIHRDEKGLIWIGSNEGMHVFDPDNNKFFSGKIESAFSKANNLVSTVHPISTYERDTMIIGSWYAGMQKVFIENGAVRSIPYPDLQADDPRSHIVSGIAKDHKGTWWIGTFGDGIAWFDPSKDQFTYHIHHDPSNSRSLGSDYINDIFTDASGIVWIGTGKGLDKFDPLTQQFTSLALPVPPNQFAVYRLINTIVEDPDDKNFLWLCISGVGLYHYNKATHEFKLYQLEEHGTDQFLKNNIYTFYRDAKDRIWIGSRTGLYWFDPGSGKFREAPSKLHTTLKSVHTVLESRQGDLWFATHSNGIYKYVEEKDELTAYSHNPLHANSLSDNRVFCMLEDTEGMMWIGTQNRGLNRLDPGTGNFNVFIHDPGDLNSIPDNGVYDLYQDENKLWLSTENGLASMDMSNFRITHYNTNDGLCNNTVFSITADHENKLWLGTNNGLSHFDPTTGHFRNYYMNDGLPLNRIDGEVFFSSDNILYLGTTGMLSYCHPEKMQLNQRIPPIVITDFSILGKKAAVMRKEEMLHPIHLGPKENMITFNFAALNFSNAFLNQYAYKLEGFDADWIYCGHNQSATYTNLNGGSYVFSVKGANNDGVWNETGTSVALIIHPPFWRTWWFYALCIAAIAAILYSIYRIRINQLLKMQSIRARIARDLHDDIGSTLSSINMLSSMADQTKANEPKSKELFHTIAAASGQAMDLMSDIVWSINPENDRMERSFIRMRQYASELLEAAGISFTLEMNEDDNDIILPLEIRKDFFLIFKEAINNLAKYSRADTAVINLFVRDHALHLIIQDNGIGFDTAKVFPGNGLKNMHTRARQMHGMLNIISGDAIGTRLELSIPLSP